MASPITTHILDTSLGKPASGIRITLESYVTGGAWKELSSGVTDADGRVRDLLGDKSLPGAGRYRMTFETGAYFRSQGTESFYPFVVVTFEIRDAGAHYHVPLLISPFGYSTYRGS